MEVPCNYCLIGQEKAKEWVKKKISAITKDHRAVVQKCLGSVYKKFQSPLYGGQFQAKCSRGTGISVRFMDCLLYRCVRFGEFALREFP